MRFTVGASVALVLATAVSAFRDSSPLLVWSNQPNDVLAEAAAELTSGVIGADAVFGSLASLGCDWDAVVVAHMDELHESHLDGIDLPLGGKDKVALHIPYLIRPDREALDVAIKSWSTRCGAEVVKSYTGPSGGRKIIYVNAEHGDLVLPANLPERSLVVLTGTRDLSKVKSHSERDERPIASLEKDKKKKKKPSKRPGTNDTRPPKEDYVYFTTPLLSALFVAFFIFFPILGLGLYALTSVQVPPRMMDINKNLGVNKSRKDQ